MEVHEACSLVHQDAGRVAGGVAQDRAAVGSFVSRPMRASSSAFRFTNAACPSMRVRRTAIGNRPRQRRVVRHRRLGPVVLVPARPRIHSPAGVVRARSTTRSMTAS
jgi:hypothetical protein